jgi:hypothetical protein
MGKTKATRKAWRKRAFEKLGMKSLADAPKKETAREIRKELNELC